MFYGGNATKFSILRRKTGGADVTPDAIDWPSVTGAHPPTSTTQTFTGIDTTITIRLNVVQQAGLDAYYNKNSGGWTLYGSGEEISIANNDTLNFKGQGFIISGGEKVTTTVVNVSDSNTELDTVYLEVESSLPP